MTEPKMEASTSKLKDIDSSSCTSVNCDQDICESSKLSHTSCQEEVRSDREPITTSQKQLNHEERENACKEIEQESVLHSNQQNCQSPPNMIPLTFPKAYRTQDSTETLSDDSISTNCLHYSNLQSHHHYPTNVSTIESSAIATRKAVEGIICEEESKRHCPKQESIAFSTELSEETKELTVNRYDLSPLKPTEVKAPVIKVDNSFQNEDKKQNLSTGSSLTTRESYPSPQCTEIGKHNTDLKSLNTDAKLESQRNANDQLNERVMISTRVKDVVTGYKTLKKNPILATVVWLLGGSTSEIDPITPPLPPQYERHREQSLTTVNSNEENNCKEHHRSNGDNRGIPRRSYRKNGCKHVLKRRERNDELIYVEGPKRQDNLNLADFEAIKDTNKRGTSNTENNNLKGGLKHPKRLQWNQLTSSGHNVQNNNINQQQQQGSSNGRDSTSSSGSSNRRLSYEEANTSPQWGWYVSLTPPTPNFSLHINNTPTTKQYS